MFKLTGLLNLGTVKRIIKTLFKHKIAHNFSIAENVVMMCPKIFSVVFTTFINKVTNTDMLVLNRSYLNLNAINIYFLSIVCMFYCSVATCILLK